VAKLRLGDFLKEENHRAEAVQSAARWKMIFGAGQRGNSNRAGGKVSPLCKRSDAA
jgi:hypothetical protein